MLVKLKKYKGDLNDKGKSELKSLFKTINSFGSCFGRSGPFIVHFVSTSTGLEPRTIICSLLIFNSYFLLSKM